MLRRDLLLPLFLAPMFACGSANPPQQRTETVEAPASEPAATVQDPAPAQEPVPAADAAPAAAAENDPLVAMHAAITELEARPEIDAERVKVQHILISFKGAPRVPATRSKTDAEKLAADLFAKLQGGADFQELMATHSDDDKVVGQYLMTATAPTKAPESFNRHNMVPAFGETGWRLKVGEIGVAPWNEAKSPYGWHIVKRLE